jgi:hypothetical protein
MLTFKELSLGQEFTFPPYEMSESRRSWSQFGVCRKVSSRCYFYDHNGKREKAQVGTTAVSVIPYTPEIDMPTRMTFPKGTGYWNVSVHPYGGHFLRFTDEITVSVIEPAGKIPGREFLCEMPDGTRIVVDSEHASHKEGSK